MQSKIIEGDALTVLRTLPSHSVDTCVTSPPYFQLRDYGVAGQVGIEATPEAYVARLVEIFREVKRVLRPDGTAWVNIGDSYAGSGKGGNAESVQQHCPTPKGNYLGKGDVKAKDLIGIPWLFAFAMRRDGWYLRQEIIWHKLNCAPESVLDRCTRNHETIFLFSTAQKYYFDHEAILEEAEHDGRKDTVMKGSPKYVGVQGASYPHRGERWVIRNGKRMRNKRSVWSLAMEPSTVAHHASYPTKLVAPCVMAGAPLGGVVLDPFFW
jgi:DNA modification methylase